MTDMAAEKQRADTAEAEVKRLRAVIAAKDLLLTAHRLGDPRRAERALTKLEALKFTEE